MPSLDVCFSNFLYLKGTSNKIKIALKCFNSPGSVLGLHVTNGCSLNADQVKNASVN